MSTHFYDLASLVVVPSGVKAGKVYAQKPMTTDGQLTFSRASTATRVNSAGLIEEVASNVPRLDYLGSSCPRLILEGQRTNLMTYSESFDNADWTKTNSTITANADISPDGYTNADRIYDDAASAQHRVGKNISVVSATTYTFSVFAKKGSLRYCYLLTVAGGTSDRYYFDLQDGVSITAGGKIEDYGSGWYRISAQVTAAATGNELFTFNLTDETKFPTYSGTGTGYHTIYGYQVEAGSYATSYVKTEAAAVTRLADAASKTGISSLIGQTEGTLFVDMTKTSAEASERYLAIGDGTTNNRIMIISGTGGFIRGFLQVAGSIEFNFTSVVSAVGTHKIALAYANNDVAMYIDGVQVTTDSSLTIPAVANLYVGTHETGSTERLNGGVNQALLFKTRLSNSSLAELTSL